MCCAPAVLAIGECMVEMAEQADGTYRLGFAGDVFNTAVYLSRLGVGVDFGSALGDDALSDGIIELAKREGVGVAMTARLYGAQPGLYVINLDPRGERHFCYWRGQSAARAMLHGRHGQTLLSGVGRYRWVYLTAVTLSILGADDRARLIAAIDLARMGGTRLAFDINYRPRGWTDAGEARSAIGEMVTRADLFLPSADELDVLEIMLPDVETVVKHGSGGCLVEGEKIPAVPVCAVDTTAAGDSFNAGYLAARLLDAPPRQAAIAGARLAARVVAHRGALIPNEVSPTMMELLN